jgi:formylglycine-generating enzyme required for sulfatase activity
MLPRRASHLPLRRWRQTCQVIFSRLLRLGFLVALPWLVDAQLSSVSIARKSDTFATLGWGSSTGKVYQLWAATNLLTGWTPMANALPGTGQPMFVDVETAAESQFYRISESAPIAGPDPARFALIQPGTFTMGSPPTEADRDSNEGPQTVVTLTRAYWISRYEVTQQEYLDLVGSNPSRNKGDLSRPVDTVSWIDATNYCDRLTESERAAGRLPSGYAYRLPTEAEWEYACRAGSTTALYYGDDPGYALLADHAWYADNSNFTTHPVGQKTPNAWGLYDIEGNVFEWCQDWYAGALPGGSVTDPQGPASGTGRVIRGGGAYSVPEGCRSATRGSALIRYVDSQGGFRPVLALVQ